MKSVINLVNVTGKTITLFSTDFPSGVPVMVYRNREFLSLDGDFGTLVNLVSDGSLVGYAFDGTPNSAEETVTTLNNLANELASTLQESSYSPEYYWKMSSCNDLLDGTRKQLLDFDFDGTGVTTSEYETLLKMDPVIGFLSAGFLDLAITIVDGTTPDGDDDFLSAARLATYRALFVSANTDI